MSCREVLDRVEAIAGGDLEPDANLRIHLESCPGCASALASARRIEALLGARPAPEAPSRFTATVQRRIRSERWESEQRVDRIFNVAIVAAVVLVVASGLFLLNAGSLFDAAGAVTAVIARVGADAAQSAIPSLGTYIAATGLLVSGLLMWWWAEY